MGKSADELRCLTSHLAAVQKPSAHGIVVCEHARRSVPGAAILLVQANGERRNASAERRRSGASREDTQHALEMLNPAARTRPKVFATLRGALSGRSTAAAVVVASVVRWKCASAKRFARTSARR